MFEVIAQDIVDDIRQQFSVIASKNVEVVETEASVIKVLRIEDTTVYVYDSETGEPDLTDLIVAAL